MVFHEITEAAIDEAFAHPREINMDLVNAQQARRILDRLVGYSISPILWEKVRSRLSAGRVQSVALRLIVEREREIDAFNPVEYWSIAAEFKPEGREEAPSSPSWRRSMMQNPVLGSEAVVNPLLEDLERLHLCHQPHQDAANGAANHLRRSPPPPCSRKPRASWAITAKRTMGLAQGLYEGVEDVGEGGTTGLITYMRTDSTNIAEQAVAEAREYIAKRYGNDFLPAKPPQYKTRAVGAQEAHEAIRPTSANRTPETVKAFLSNRPVQALPADLAALRGLPDGSGGVRHAVGRGDRQIAPRTSTCSAPPVRRSNSRAS